MKITWTDGKWLQLIRLVDDGIHTIALNANVSHEDLRYRYVMACLHINQPFQYNISNLKTKHKNEKGCNQLQIHQNATNIYEEVYMKQHQRKHFGYNCTRGNGRSNSRHIRQSSQCYQQNFYRNRNVRGLNMLPYSTASTAINSNKKIHLYKMNDNNKFNGDSITISKFLQPPKHSNKKGVAKFYCDIEAALAGEISDAENDNVEATTYNGIFNKAFKNLSNNNATLNTSALLAKQTMALMQEQLKESKQLETRIVRYPNGKSLALNIIHKVYVVALEDSYAWVRLCDGNRPPCFDAAHIMLKATKSLAWEELLPGTPCVVLTPFNPLDVVNDGIAREVTEFESYARAIIEQCDQLTKTVTVRLVDFGFRLTQLNAKTIKPLTIPFDGPPLAIRLLIDFLPKRQKESLCRYITLCVRLAASREKQFLCWSKTWEAIDIKKQNWNSAKSDCSSSNKSSEMHKFNNNNGHYGSPASFGALTRDFVSSWLNKEHKKAGGRGIEAALCDRANNHTDLPPNQFALTKQDNCINEKFHQSMRSSDNCFSQLISNHTTKTDSNCPLLSKLPKTIAEISAKEPLKENQRKEKLCQDKMPNSEGQNHPIDSNQIFDSIHSEKINQLENCTDATIKITENTLSDLQFAHSSVRTTHTCRDLL